jgi:hypothetical protein
MQVAHVLAQMPPVVARQLPGELDDMATFLADLHKGKGAYPRAVVLAVTPRGWSVTVDGVVDSGQPGRQAGSRGSWPTMRMALLVAVLLCERPELPIVGDA